MDTTLIVALVHLFTTVQALECEFQSSPQSATFVNKCTGNDSFCYTVWGNKNESTGFHILSKGCTSENQSCYRLDLQCPRQEVIGNNSFGFQTCCCYDDLCNSKPAQINTENIIKKVLISISTLLVFLILFYIACKLYFYILGRRRNRSDEDTTNEIPLILRGFPPDVVEAMDRNHQNFWGREISNPPEAAAAINQDSISENEEIPETCAVCLESVDCNLKTIPCEHSFCRRCIKRWMREGNIGCPLCRTEIIRLQKNEN